MSSRSEDELKPAPRPESAVQERSEDLPVVARLVVEVRSDGSRTIARGALEDASQGVRVGIEAKGDTPLELAAALTKSMFQLPLLRRADQALGAIRRGVRGLLPRPK